MLHHSDLTRQKTMGGVFRRFPYTWPSRRRTCKGASLGKPRNFDAGTLLREGRGDGTGASCSTFRQYPPLALRTRMGAI